MKIHVHLTGNILYSSISHNVIKSNILTLYEDTLKRGKTVLFKYFLQYQLVINLFNMGQKGPKFERGPVSLECMAKTL